MNKKQFVKEVAQSLNSGLCDLFVGSGISAPSGLPTWGDFLQPLLSEIGIQIRDGDDLPLLAQYIVNSNSGNRNSLANAVYLAFGKDFPTNSYHNTLSSYPVSTIWTTNFDNLLEKAFQDRHPRIICSEDSLLHPYKPTGTEIIKLHGDAKSAARGIVLTRDDYNHFLYRKQKIAQRLREAIINRSIFFLGYSYQDPDIQFVMTQATHMKGEITNTHYILLCDLKKKDGESYPDYNQRVQRFQLWISELHRIGIHECVVPKSEIGAVLSEIEMAARNSTVFVTGKHDASPKENDYANQFGRRLAELNRVILNCGQSSGIGNATLSGFMTAVFEKKQDLNARIKVFPNPYTISPAFADDPALLPSLKDARLPVISSSALIVAFPGSMGTEAEIELALAKERIVLPVIVQVTDRENMVIKKILTDTSNMNQIKKRAARYYETIMDKTATTKLDEIIDAIREVLDDKE